MAPLGSLIITVYMRWMAARECLSYRGRSRLLCRDNWCWPALMSTACRRMPPTWQQIAPLLRRHLPALVSTRRTCIPAAVVLAPAARQRTGSGMMTARQQLPRSWIVGAPCAGRRSATSTRCAPAVTWWCSPDQVMGSLYGVCRTGCLRRAAALAVEQPFLCGVAKDEDASDAQ